MCREAEKLKRNPCPPVLPTSPLITRVGGDTFRKKHRPRLHTVGVKYKADIEIEI